MKSTTVYKGTTSHFYHRSNRDGSTDSICSRCFVRVGRESHVSELGKYETVHVCDPEKVFEVSQRAHNLRFNLSKRDEELRTRQVPRRAHSTPRSPSGVL